MVAVIVHMVVVMVMRVMMVAVIIMVVIVTMVVVIGGAMRVGRARTLPMRSVCRGALAVGFHISIAAAANRTHQSTSSSLILNSSPAVTCS